jgi:ADP-heptose:LPS heptosyltransferase
MRPITRAAADHEPAARGERWLWVRRGAFGDTLLLTAVLRAVRRSRPGLGLELAGVHEYAEVLQHFGVVDAAWSSERLASGESSRRGELLRPYARVFSDDPTLAAVAPPGTVVACYDPRPQRAEPLPRQLAAQVGVELQWPADAWLAQRRANGVGTVLAPGSGGRAKCWPRTHWLSLAAHLAALGERCQVVVGPTELERDDPRSWPWPSGTTFLHGLRAVELAERLRSARAFVGNDSGPSHLAALLQLPTAVLFGGGQPAVYAPAGAHVEVVRSPADELTALSPATVLAAWQRAAAL